MAETKYTDSERYKRGIDRILKSDQYTAEYKQILMDKLGNNYNVPKESVSKDVDFDLLKNGGPVVTLSQDTGSLVNINDKPAAVSGYIEKPTYLEDELMRAVDVEVDELIKAPPKQKSPTVPKPVYDDLAAQYAQAVNDLEDLRAQLNQTISELESAIADINLLNQTVDSEKLLRAASENETQASTERYRSVLNDFQIALQKGIQEAIERVSLTAQVRGLQAQKEVLQQQLENLKAITESLQGQIETQQLQIQAQQNTIEQQQEEAAAAFLLTGTMLGKTSNSGWKVPESNIGSTDTGKYILYWDKDKGQWINGNLIELYNLSEEEELIFTFTYVKGERDNVKGDNKSKPFIQGPTSVTVPARVGSVPGVVPVTFTKNVIWQADKFWNSSHATDLIQIQVSNNDKYTLDAKYKIK